MPTAVDTSFFGDFVLGDNIKRNVGTLGVLYASQSDEPSLERKGLYRKPIIITCVSIIEACLYDLVFRIRNYNREGVRGITSAVTGFLKSVPNDDFSFLIDQCKRHSLLGPRTDPIYEALSTLRDCRNRIHIQDKKRVLERRESSVFRRDRQILAERTLEQVLNLLSSEYHRDFDYVGGFELPWDTHFP